jgi:DNA-binding XRE family transcriptional regulator
VNVRPLSVLLYEARRALHMNRQDIGKAIGWSYRTIVRWETRHTDVYSPSLLKIVPRVHAVDPQLAAEIAMACGSSLVQLGIGTVPAQNVAAAAQRTPVSLQHLADSVACAAADALHAAPEAVRPALLAAFRRARELRMTFDDVESALTEALAPKVPTARAKAKE